MNEILQGLIQAFWLILSFDSELITISLRSLYVTISALIISILIAFPLAALLVVTRFQFRRAIIVMLNALMGLPPVVVGLIVYILFTIRYEFILHDFECFLLSNFLKIL